MALPLRPTRLLRLSELEPSEGSPQESEVAALAALEQAGLAVAPLRLIPAGAEERFYRLNNLPQQLLELFAGVDRERPDEDDLEELAPEAEALVGAHFLLDEFIDLFYLGLEGLPDSLRVRRPGELPGRTASRGRPALLALKRLWADEWSFERLFTRLDREQGIALPARPVLMLSAGLDPAPVELEVRAAEVLGQPVTLYVEPGGAITAAVGVDAEN